jgi:hypothetical protein
VLPGVRDFSVPQRPRCQRQQVIQVISDAEARGQQRLAEMNRRVLGNLDQTRVAVRSSASERRSVVALC